MNMIHPFQAGSLPSMPSMQPLSSVYRANSPIQSPQFSGGAERVNPSSEDRYIAGPYATLLRLVPIAPVSQVFISKVVQGLDSLPTVVPTALKTYGWKIHLATFLSDAAPRLKDLNPRGSDPWAKADHSGAVCISPHIYMGENQWVAQNKGPSKLAAMKFYPGRQPVEPPVESESGIQVRNIAPDRTIRHEIGHAVDEILLRPSSSEGFKQAYLKDIQALSDKGREGFYYYIQPDSDGNPTKGGRREAWAEAFANLYGGGGYQTEVFCQAFPNTLRFVGQAIADWEARGGKQPSAWSKGPPPSLRSSKAL